MTLTGQSATALRDLFEQYWADGLSSETAIAKLAVDLDDELDADDVLKLTLDEQPRSGRWVGWLQDITELLSRPDNVFDTLRATAASVSHDLPAAQTATTTIRQLARGFDKAVMISPAASVQLSSLGDEERLLTTTAEVASWLERHGFTGADKTILDIGCGIGRFEEAFHAKARRVIGIDISPHMIAQARQRCSRLANVEFRHTSGMDLAAFATASLDAVLAVDSFPYLVLAGVAEQHLGEIARVLRPGGMAAILNYSYRAQQQIDVSDIDRLAHAHGMSIVVGGDSPFTHWDGIAFLLRRDGAPGGAAKS